MGCLARAARAAGKSALLAGAIAGAISGSIASVAGAAETGSGEPRPYVAGMIAGSGPLSGSSLPERARGTEEGASGGAVALGIALPQPAGWLRLEVETLGRETAAENGQRWATLANAWRDLAIDERFSLYGGGGIGVESAPVLGALAIVAGPLSPPVFRTAANHPAPAATGPSTGIAWQAGAGVAWAATERITIDLGYRHRGTGGSAPGGEPAGELMLAVRVY